MALLVATGLNNHYRETGRANNAAAQEYRQAQPIAPPRPLTQGPATKDEAPTEQQRTYRDLQAQEKMARWAFLMTIVTGVGVLLLGATLHETWKAGKAAAVILTHTKRQADIAENSFRRLERPYLFIEVADIVRFDSPGKKKPAMRYRLTNYGKTPAIFESIFLELCDISKIEFANGRPRVRAGASRKQWYEVLAQGGSTGDRLVEVAGSKAGETVDPSTPLALHGVLHYQDPMKTFYSYHFVLTRQDGRFCLDYSEDHTEYPEDCEPPPDGHESA